MSVFISYRHSDRQKAFEVANILKLNNISYYLDVIDDESRGTSDITEVITKNIEKCTHLLAIISPNTRGSWWVPFEIGEATALNRRICSYAFDTEYKDLSKMLFSVRTSDFPEYLKKWPVLLSKVDLQKFVQQYKQDSITILVNESRGRIGSSLSRANADKFHSILKSQL